MPRPRISLRARWTLAILLCGVLPLCVLCYATLTIQRHGLLRAGRELSVAVTDHVATVVEHTLSEAAETTHRVGRVLSERSISDPTARLSLAREALARSEILAQVAIYSPQGELLDAISHGEEVARPPQRLPAPTSPEPRWLAPSYEAGSAVLRYLEPIERDGARRALLLSTLSRRALGGHLEEISRDRFEDRPDGVLLIDGELRVLAGAGQGSLAVGQALRGRDALQALTPTADLFRRPLIAAHEFHNERGDLLIGAVRSLPQRGWAVVVRCPGALVFGALAGARRLLLIFSVLIALAALLCGALMAARTTRPLGALLTLTSAIAHRDFAARKALGAATRTGDEIETLGEAMIDMAEELERSEAELAQKTTVQANLCRYLPREVAAAIARGEASLSLGGQRRTITVLFADVVSFTTFAERAAPERVVAFLNELFTVLTEVVFRHNGTIDKFIGDCVMVLFGAPEAQQDHAARALATAEDIHRFVETNAAAWKARYDVEVRLSIGVASGEAVVGNLGSESRMDYTAIGDVVNTAARVQALARPGQTLVTAEAAQAAGSEFALLSMGEHPLRGKRQTVQIFEAS